MAIMEGENPNCGAAASVRDLANMQTILTLMQLNANLNQFDEDAVDTTTIRLLRWAESNKQPEAIERYTRLRQAVRARFTG